MKILSVCCLCIFVLGGYVVYSQTAGKTKNTNHSAVILIGSEKENLIKKGNLLSKNGYRVRVVKFEKESADEHKVLTKVSSIMSSLSKIGIKRIALIEFGTGGHFSFDFFSAGDKSEKFLGKIKAVVVYEGQLDLKESKVAMVKCPILGIFQEGKGDEINEFAAYFHSMVNDLKITNEVYVYTSPNDSLEKTTDAMDKIVLFLDKYLKS